MKAWVIFCLSALLCSSLYAQTDKKSWADGKLTWEDFNEGPFPVFNYFLENKLVKTRYKDTLVIREKVICFIEKTRLRVNNDFKSEQGLRYFQVLFDLGELHRRAIQKEMDNPSYSEGQNMENLDDQFRLMRAEFEGESNFGNDLNAIEEWELRVSRMLSAAESDVIPKYQIYPIGVGMFAGGGAYSLSDGLKDQYTNGGLFSLGFDFNRNKSFLLWFLGIGGTTARVKSISPKAPWIENQKLSITHTALSYGYAVWNNRVIRVVPHGGVGLLGFSEQTGEDENGYSVIRAVPYFGLNVDFKLRKTLNFVRGKFIHDRESREVFLRTHVGVHSARFHPLVTGNMLHFGVQIGTRANGISLAY